MTNDIISSILDTLNLEQKKAALHSGGPAVIFAGAGSGKTRVIAARISILLAKGVRPYQILSVTFTNKASNEMKERLVNNSQLGGKVHVGTFHSSCVRWLREFASELGFTSNFSVYDEKDSQSAIKTILKDSRIDMEETPAKVYAQMIANAKTMGWSPQDLEQHVGDCSKKFPPLSVQVYKKYQEYLINCNAMDFSDLLMNMILLLRTNKQVQQTISNRYNHILVDEYQDTNPIQFDLIQKISGPHTNLFVVGDDDQSIYSWRGARPEHIIKFKEFYPSAIEIKLEQNYRSSKMIVDAATSLISKNKNRSDKNLWTDNSFGNKISYVREYDSEAEAWWVVDNIRAQKKHISYKDIAILYRTNAQSRQLEDVLIKENISYRIYGSLRFYDRAEIKDITSYIRLIVNPDDDLALKRVINVPTRGIGKKTVTDLEDQALRTQQSIFAVLKDSCARASDRKSKKLHDFLDIIAKITEVSLSEDLSKIVSKIIEITNYKEYIHKKHQAQASDKLSNLMELDTVLYEYCQKSPHANLSDWIKDISLSSKQAGQEEDEGISILTLHSAKGLEFKKVYIVGVEDGLLPHQNSLSVSENIEEERRLLYVGMTRAREELYLTSAITRRINNKYLRYEPSRFLQEIPRQVFSEKSLHYLKDKPACKNISLGQKINHPTYGIGVVRKIEKHFGSTRGLIEFKRVGMRLMSLDHLAQNLK
jgi:DNA helicase II / ATP-dependent DNA helicase PcrA